jgi:hypothetical protein
VSLQKVTLGKTKTEAIHVQFSDQINAAAADNLTAYALTTAPQGKKHTTRPLALGRAIYNAATASVNLIPKKSPITLRPAPILTINGASLLDTLGRQIDAKHDGLPGGIYKAMLTKAGAVVSLAVHARDALLGI